MPRTITCACCGREGPHHARNLVRACWRRHQKHGTLARFPLTQKEKKPRPPRWRNARRADDVLDAYVERVRGASPGVSLAIVAADIGMQRKTLHKVLQRARHRGDPRADVRLPRASMNEYRRLREMFTA
jgi:hypothetical protein